MAEAIGLPVGDHRGGAFDHFAQQRQPGFVLFQALREVAGHDVFAEGLQVFVLARVVEVFEVAEAHVALRQAQHHGRAFLLLAPHRRARSRHAQRARAGDTEGVQVFAGEKFADRAAQYCAAIAHARVRRHAGALEVQVPVLSGLVDHLAQQQPATVAQARGVAAELVPGIDHGARLGFLPEFVSGEQFGELGALCFASGEIEQSQG